MGLVSAWGQSRPIGRPGTESGKGTPRLMIRHDGSVALKGHLEFLVGEQAHALHSFSTLEDTQSLISVCEKRSYSSCENPRIVQNCSTQ